MTEKEFVDNSPEEEKLIENKIEKDGANSAPINIFDIALQRARAIKEKYSDENIIRDKPT
jgi:hypothetical protein